MSSNLAIQIWPEVLRSLAFGSISGTYAGISTATTNPTRIYWLQNNTDVTLTFSWDGLTDHFKLPTNAFILLDVTSNKSATGGMAAVPTGTRTYVKGTPTSGTVDLTIFYGKNG